MLCENSDSNRRKKYFLLPSKDSAYEKIMDSLLLLSFYRNSPLILNKPFFFFFPGEIADSLFVLGQLFSIVVEYDLII